MPDSIFLEGNDHAILLLHTFTGTVRDVKQLGVFLNKEGYSVHIPSYPGHGLPIEEFIKYDIEDWYKTVEQSYLKLKETYTSVSLIGVSLGGLFSLKLAEQYDVNQLIVMSVPMKKDVDGIKYRLRQFAPRMHKLITEVPFPESHFNLIENYEGANKFVDFIDEVMKGLNKIISPTAIFYGDLDDVSYHQSAQYIFDNINSDKSINHYPHARHLMITSADKDKIFNDILQNINKQ
ncbi:alpha/beta hydrolase [Macrococcus equi]|uniref:alpha/beta hydrolase n=1 Tax=Macrococcus equi TaxID=3395462 RepID=UPI0039BDE6C7